MVGITSFGFYVPAYRLKRDEISRAWKMKSLGGERAVAGHDEDSLTMAVNATLDCMKVSQKAGRWFILCEHHFALQRKAGGRYDRRCGRSA